ncbi:MAG TPA: hypothetical protein VEY67_10030 [Candidatus Dormibacteraeota bacterium]|nr:hypothetical protein [Candidatus Dormibacteraeota bacterium]
MATRREVMPASPVAERTREQLLSDHADARRRRDAAALASDAFRQAAFEVERIEVAIAALERSMEPPRM